MAITHTVNSRSVWGDKRVHQVTTTFDTSYPTGGEAIVASDYGLTVLEWLSITDIGAANVIAWDKTNSKLKAYVRTTGVEVADTVDIHTTAVEVLAVGR